MPWALALQVLLQIMSFVFTRVNLTIEQKEAFIKFVEAMSKTGLAPISLKKASEKLREDLIKLKQSAPKDGPT